jgi:hypothetical protein
VFHLFIWLLDVEIHMASGRYLSVISASGCETIVMNQTALKNSDQNVSQQVQNITAAHATPPGLWPFQNPRSQGDAYRVIGMRAWFGRLFVNAT